MRHPIKVQISKNEPLGYSWTRYRPIDKILIEDNGTIKTEAQLCFYIYKKFGEGRYQLIAWQKGHEGFLLYWLGNILSNGFIRDLKVNKEIDKLKKEWSNARTYEEKFEIEEDIQFEKELYNEEKKLKRRGPIGLIKSRPGILNAYESF